MPRARHAFSNCFRKHSLEVSASIGNSVPATGCVVVRCLSTPCRRFCVHASRFSFLWHRHEAAPNTHQDQGYGDAPPSPCPLSRAQKTVSTLPCPIFGGLRRPQFLGFDSHRSSLPWLTAEASRLKRRWSRRLISSLGYSSFRPSSSAPPKSIMQRPSPNRTRPDP